MTDRDFLNDYFDRYRVALATTGAFDAILQAASLVRRARDTSRKLLIAGNGGSAAIADHAALDFTKQGGVRAISFSSSALITALGNDVGYENWLARGIELHGDDGDVAVLISTSGRSPNILNAAHTARSKGLNVVTFSGHAADNPLRTLGDVNFWLESRAYNVVENLHQIWLLAICDTVIGRAEYSVS